MSVIHIQQIRNKICDAFATKIDTSDIADKDKEKDIKITTRCLAAYAVHYTSVIVFRPLPSDDPKQRKPDITLATQKLTGWYPAVTLEQGLQKTIEYFENVIYH